MSLFKLSVTFLAGTFHGRGDQGRPEWPPSPLRAFQALVATAARAGNSRIPDEFDTALDWLAAQPAPAIVAPPALSGVPYQTSVPNNAMDIVARAWSRGSDSSKDAQPATHKAMKTVRPQYLDPGVKDDANHTVNYVWDLPAGGDWQAAVDCLQRLASQLVALGWGLDLVAGHGEVVSENQVSDLRGERWLPGRSGSCCLQVPTASIRQHLERRHGQFTRRLVSGTLHPVPPLPTDAVQTVGYQRDFERPSATVAVFSLRDTEGSHFRAFPLCRSLTVAGMLRHAVSKAARHAGWTDERIASFVLGHGEARNRVHEPVGRERFAYVPLPSLEPRGKGMPADHVGMIRRALVYVPAGTHTEDTRWLSRALAGTDLVSIESSEPVALIGPPPTGNDFVLKRYLPDSAVTTWSTVTPVILPGFDDRRRSKTESLIRKAILQAGFSDTLTQHADLDWRQTGFLPGAEHVNRYQVPKHLEHYPRYHVRISWRNTIGQPVQLTGPLAIGGGRYAGLGLFATDEDSGR